MDTDELARIASGLLKAIAEANAMAKEFGIGPQFRELVQHAREMHELLIEALLADESLSTEYLHGLSESTGNAIEQLEALEDMPDGKMQ